MRNSKSSILYRFAANMNIVEDIVPIAAVTTAVAVMKLARQVIHQGAASVLVERASQTSPRVVACVL